MKEYKINDQDIAKSFDQTLDEQLPYDIPDFVDNKVKNMIRDHNPQSVFQVLTGFLNRPWFKMGLAAAVIVLIIIPVVTFMIGNFTILPQNIFYTGTFSVVRKGRNLVISDMKAIIKDDLLVTGPESSCKVFIEEKTVALITENSKIRLDRLSRRQIKVKIEAGQVLFDVDPEHKKRTFLIDTENARVMVLGTQFGVILLDNNLTQIIVNRGRVNVTNKNTGESCVLSEQQFVLVDQDSLLVSTVTDEIKESFLAFSRIQLREINPIREQQEHIVIETEETQEKERGFQGQRSHIYTFNSTETAKNRVIGITAVRDSVVVVSENALVCLDLRGQVKWHRQYGIKSGVYFMSQPVVVADKLFLSSLNKQLVVIDCKSGDELQMVDAPGTISYGYSPVIHRGLIYLPFKNGLYTCNPVDNNISQDSVVQFNGPTTPLFIDNMIIVSSFLEGKLSGFSDHKLGWEQELEARSFNSVVTHGKYIFTGDNDGYIYKVAFDGTLVKTLKAPDSVLSLYAIDQDTVYAVIKDGGFYAIDFAASKIDKLFTVEDRPDTTNYLTRDMIKFDKYLVTGNNQGLLLFYDYRQNRLDRQIAVANHPVTIARSFDGESIFVGSKSGDVFLVE